MTTRNMIDRLRRGEIVDLALVATRLEELMEYIDDMYMDHYVDNLEWYSERCWELQDEIDKLTEGRK